MRRNRSVSRRSLRLRSSIKHPAALRTALGAAVLLGGAHSTHAQYSIQPLGLTDPQHLNPNGVWRSYATLANAAGCVVGYSGIYDLSSDSWWMNSLWLWDGMNTHQIGLLDAEHTAADGLRLSSSILMNGSGQVIGQSTRYLGGYTEMGETAWLYAGGRTFRLGYIDGAHTRSDGYRYSEAEAINERGEVVGYSARYASDDQDAGWTEWLFSGGALRPLGLNDALHTALDGHQEADAIKLNNHGQVAGDSRQFDGTDEYRSTAWIYDNGNITTLGLVNAEHTAADGRRDSSVFDMNEKGQVIGHSTRYSGNATAGTSAWISDSGTITRIGLTDSSHTASDGFQESGVCTLTESGYAAGYSQRYDGLVPRGESAWVYGHSTRITTRVGLVDPDHTAADGTQSSYIEFVNESGMAAGSSSRYVSGDIYDQSAWVYDGTTTTRVGLTGGVHTSSSGAQYSRVYEFNAAGDAVGQSFRFRNAQHYGDSAWIYSNHVTTQIGVTDARHTSSGGFQFNVVLDLNDAGQVIGTANLYDGSTPKGQSGWFYDRATNQTVELVFAQNSEGEAFTSPAFLGEDGTVIGTFREYSLGGARTVPFLWRLADGFHRLMQLDATGVAAQGWLGLDEPRFVSRDGSRIIVGTGLRSMNSELSDQAYLLSIVGGGAWVGGNSGAWDDKMNWSLSGAPTHGDDAVFSANGATSVSLHSHAQAHDLHAAAGNVTLDLAQHHLSLSNKLQVDSAQLKVAHGKVVTRGLDIATAGKLDLTDSVMFVDYDDTSPLIEITGYIAAGRIFSTAGAAGKSLGVVDTALIGQSWFYGEALDATSVVVGLTYAGDCNLDQRVDISDLYALASNWHSAGSWLNGDFDYSGFVDAADLARLAMNWQAGTSGGAVFSLPGVLAALGLPGASVPEPQLVAFSCLAAGALHRRRRR